MGSSYLPRERSLIRAGIACLLLLLGLIPARAGAAAPAFAGPEVDITREGSAQASTTSTGYPASLSVDGDPTTSWFSTGPEPGGVPTHFQWTHPRDDLISTVYIHGNGQNKTVDFRKNYGFGSITVQVLDAAGKVVFSQAVALPGTPDPDVTVHPNVTGRTVLLLLSGHESPDCGGFSELQVKAERTPAAPVPPKQPTTAPQAPAAAAGTVIASDTFNRSDLDRCQLGPTNNALGGSRTLYYLPIFPTGGNDASHPIGANLVSGALQNNGLDYGGIQFAASPTPCQGVRGANIGQDLNLRVDLVVPTDAAGHVAQAGPYVRSRAAAPGDGIIGGTSAGYWVQLETTGEVKVKRLNPNAVIAFSGKPTAFDPAVFHTLEIAAGGSQLQVALDGKLQTFNQDNPLATSVNIPATGGSNDGTAGIAFSAEANRGQIGGQRAKNIILSGYRPLTGLPVQNNFAGATPLNPAPPSVTVPPFATVPPFGAVPPSGTAMPTAGATAGSTLTALNPPANPVPPGLPGDCDADAKITESDALCALEMSVQLRPANPLMKVDNSGGDVTSRDAVIILQRALGK